MTLGGLTGHNREDKNVTLGDKQVTFKGLTDDIMGIDISDGH